jgi:hypothetical protein
MITAENIVKSSQIICIEWENMSPENKQKLDRLMSIFRERFMIFVFKSKIRVI